MNPDSNHLRILAYSCVKRFRCRDYLTTQYVEVNFHPLESPEWKQPSKSQALPGLARR